MNSSLRLRLDRERVIGSLLAVLAFAVYVATLSRHPFPGVSAMYLAQGAGLVPQLTILTPIWNGVARLVAAVPLGSLAGRLALFSAVCAALAVGLLYRLISEGVTLLIAPTTVDENKSRIAGRMAGLGAALFLLFSGPFWSVANRAHPAAFHTLLMLTVAWLLLRFAQTRTLASAALVAFVGGLGIVEFPTMVLFAPLVAGIVLYGLWDRGKLNFTRGLAVAAAALAGLSLMVLAAWLYKDSVGYRVMRYQSTLHVIVMLLRAMYVLLSRTLPQEGWLMVVLLTGVPWLTVISMAPRGLNESTDRATLLLNTVLTAVSIGLLLNVRPAPWATLGWQPLLVTPYVLAASVFGYLLAYWYILPTQWWRWADTAVRRWIRQRLGGVLAVALLVTSGISAIRNFEGCDGRPSRTIAQLVARLVEGVPRDDSGQESWLVTDGSLDDVMVVLAHEREIPLKTISLAGAYNEPYLNYLGWMLGDPRLRNLAHVNMLSMLEAWLKGDPDIHRRAAVAVLPDLWFAAGYRPLPRHAAWIGITNVADVATENLLPEQEAFWDAMIPSLRELASQSRHPLSGMASGLLRHLSMQANDLGVFLEDAGKETIAARAYQRARDIYPNNISALLNLAILRERVGPEDEKEAIRKEMRDLSARARTLPHLWTLSRYYGYVRSPQAFAGTGWTWALSGQPSLAIAGLKRAMEIAPPSQKGRVKEMLAGVYQMMAQEQESEALYRELLAQDPRNTRALLGLARDALLKGKLEEADALLRQADAAGAAKTDLAMDWAVLNLQAGRVDAARVILEDLVLLQPEWIKPRALLAAVLLEQQDEPALEKRLQELSLLKGGYALVAEIRGRQALRRGDALEARRHIEEAYRSAPRTVALLEQLVQLDLMTGKRDALRGHVAELLSLDPGSAMGNYARGYLQIQSGELDLAEDSLRRSLARMPTFPAHNDLAWVLMRRGAYAEAERHARAAVAMNDQSSDLWDTLGEVLMRTQQYEEAEKALLRAASLNPEDMGVVLNMAELQWLKGDRARAREFLDQVATRRSDLSPEQVERLGNLRRSLDRR